MRRTLLAAIVGALVMTGLTVQPASAKSKAPPKVGLVSFVKADYSRSSNRVSMWIDWPNAKRAEKYEIYVSTSYSMKRAKKYTSRSSEAKLTNLSRGKDYFVQVRGVNNSKRGQKSSRVGHTAIVRPGPSRNLLPLRIMSYNVCSRVCGTSSWNANRRDGVHERIAASGADVVAVQEGDNLKSVPGYEMSVYKSAKGIFYDPARLSVAAVDPAVPVYGKPANDKYGCSPTYQWGQPTGYVLLGYHGGGCRYAVWTEFVDNATQRHFLMVSAHLVTGSGTTPTAQRSRETAEMLAHVQRTNGKGLAVLYAGDWNSHKGSKNGDAVAPVMKSKKLYDGYDLARNLTHQHVNSFNGFSSTPRLGYTWGDHIDKLWVNPYTTRVDAWTNFARFGSDGKLVQPIPSDHSPIVTDVRIG